MSMLKELVEHLLDYGHSTSEKVEEHLGHPYLVNRDGAKPLPHPPPMPWREPEVYRVHSLKGIALLLKANINDLILESQAVLCRPDNVHVVGSLEGAEQNCPTFMTARYQEESLPGKPLGLQQFRLEVVRCFESCPERQRLLEDTAAFSFKSAIVKEERQDGLGISTSDKRDRLAQGTHTVKDPVYKLHPWRSFPEAGPQVEVPHLLQIAGGEDIETTATLTDCGGSAWIATAAQQVGEHVQDLCKEHEVDIAIVW